MRFISLTGEIRDVSLESVCLGLQVRLLVFKSQLCQFELMSCFMAFLEVRLVLAPQSGEVFESGLVFFSELLQF